jgi:hypothetical protein
MTWAERRFSKSAVDRAGVTLVSAPKVSDEPAWSDYDVSALESAFEVVGNWRACHAFLLNTFQAGLRNRARQLGGFPLIAQRTKRLASIVAKLERFPTMTLSQMQDIGGCRAAVTNVQKVRQLGELYVSGNLKHELHTVDDYIARPQDTGYRGIHLIYRYRSDKNTRYNGLKIEMQLRSRMQHAWATAVETVDFFTRSALKASQGPRQWHRFFALMGSVLALRERTPLVADTPEDPRALLSELRSCAADLRVVERLSGYGSALNVTQNPGLKGAKYFLMQLDPSEKSVLVTGFNQSEISQAQDAYLVADKDVRTNPIKDAVLVSVETLTLLRRAYPNYFLDTRRFIEILQWALKRKTASTLIQAASYVPLRKPPPSKKSASATQLALRFGS